MKIIPGEETTCNATKLDGLAKCDNFCPYNQCYSHRRLSSPQLDSNLARLVIPPHLTLTVHYDTLPLVSYMTFHFDQLPPISYASLASCLKGR
jgi:hypothetical protein